ncbi:glycosyltransferase [Chelativorans alearense]|uniref:glycosyltransferase n=1 Tax=Chelativorans alearense TaxID=2681495 RepID=UPI0013D5759E|nr:glycosyltransferase [Chelativorans alearense]
MTSAVPSFQARPMKTLRELYAEHNGKVSDKWTIYLETYEQLLSRFRNRPVRLLEIGVQNGGSLEIWRKYFPKAKVIVGCDINPDCRKLTFGSKKIALIVGDANSDEVEHEILAQSPQFDIIIDDGSHKSSDIVRSFALYFGHLAEGGIYIAEDLHCSYWQEFEGGLYDPYSSMSFFKRLLDILNHEHWGTPHERVDALAAFANRYSTTFDETLLASIHSVEFVNSVCVLTKCAPIRNGLGKRKIAGGKAVVYGGIIPLDGSKSRPSDQTQNIWSLGHRTLEEEIVANRKLVDLQRGEIARMQVDLEGKVRQIEALGAQVASKEAEVERQSAEFSTRFEVLGAQVASKEAEVERQSAEFRARLNDREEEIEALNQELSHSQEQENRLRSVIEGIHRSTSWRVTKPLRAAKRLLAGQRHRNGPSNDGNGGGASGSLQRGHEDTPGSDAPVKSADNQDTRAATHPALPHMCAEKPLVSVIIPVKNGLPQFKRVIDMVSSQELDAGFEIIVIDSGSKDGSKEIIPAGDPRFRLIEIKPAAFGHGRTRNLGVREARGEFCAFLTHDATPVDRFWLRELVKPLLEDDQVAGVFGRHIAYEDATPFTAWELKTHFTGLRNWPKIWIKDAREYSRNQGIRQVFHFYSDNSSCLRKSVWERYPYPDVDFSEDQLWAKQIVEAGFRKAFAWDSVVYHSHDYSLWERVQRSYDEARALNELFGYKLCPSKRELMRQSFRTSARDVMLALRNGWILSHPAATLKRPLDNLARQIGYYLGTTRSTFAQKHATALSRDKQLQAR